MTFVASSSGIIVEVVKEAITPRKGKDKECNFWKSMLGSNLDRFSY